MRLEDVKRYLPFQSSRSPSEETIYEPLRGEVGHDGEKDSIAHDCRAPKHSRTKWIAGFVMGIICGAACTWLLFVSSIVIAHEAGLASDAYFGHIPMRKVVWENDTALMDNDPFDGRFWTQDDNFTDSPWDALKRGAWIQVPHTPKLGIFGGLPLPKYALAGQNFSPEAQGFVPAVWHDLHCIGAMKHMIMQLNTKAIPEMTPKDYMHSTHCLERWRLQTMCTGDLSLGAPKENNTHLDVTGWGTIHWCRDWTVLKKKLDDVSISFTEKLEAFDNVPGHPGADPA